MTDAFWTFDAVEERLIEAMRFWWRSPGGGSWPFAGDGPWHLVTRLARAGSADEVWRIEHDELKAADRRPVQLPLTRDDIARRDEASEWLAHVPPADRELVVAALVHLAAGAKPVPWTRLKHRLGIRFGADGLRKRYSRAVAGIAAALNDQKTGQPYAP